MNPIVNDFEPKCLCVLVLDTSGSMNANNAIVELNDSLQRFKKDIELDSVTRDRLEVCIIAFDSAVKVLQQPDKLTNFEMPRLKAQGCSLLVPALEKAQELIKKRIDYYKSQGICYYRPWIIVITDGDPYPCGQDISTIASKIKTDVNNRHYYFVIIGIGDMQSSVLSTLETEQMPAFKTPINKIPFEEFFTFLSQS